MAHFLGPECATAACTGIAGTQHIHMPRMLIPLGLGLPLAHLSGGQEMTTGFQGTEADVKAVWKNAM